MDLALALAARARRRPRAGQRPGRRPLRRGRARPRRRRLADAARRRGRRAARRTTCSTAASPAARLRRLDRLLVAARRDRRGAGHPLRGDAHRLQVDRAGCHGLRFGYEEALGYCVDPERVRDKDGVSAALLMAELAAELKAEGRTLLDLLDDLALEHGLHATDQLSVRVDDLALIGAAMHAAARARRRPSLGGCPVDSARRPRAADRRPAADRRAALSLDGRAVAGGRAAERHRAQAQVLPRGRSCRSSRRRERRAGRPGRRRQEQLARAAGRRRRPACRAWTDVS